MMAVVQIIIYPRYTIPYAEMRLLTGLGPASWCQARTLARGQDSSTVQVRRVTVDCVARRLGYSEYGDPGKVGCCTV